MAPFQLLEPREEDELHKLRLLNVEEKPFKRVTKRLQTLHTLMKWGKPVDPAAAEPGQQRTNGVPGNRFAVSSSPSTPPTATPALAAAAEPAMGDGSVKADANAADSDAEQLAQMRELLTHDFAAFDSSIVRLQFLMTANVAERERYMSDRQAILDTCQEVREKNASLRAALDEARVALEGRRKLDDLADKITSNRMLKPRADQRANLAKLEEECAQLKQESEAYAVTWRERRDQFARIMDESMRLRRQIRDEKEEVDRREGMGEEDNEDVSTPRPGVASGNATPLPAHHHGGGHGASALASSRVLLADDLPANGHSRPASTTGGRTPGRESPGPSPQDVLLKPRPDASGGFGTSQSQAGSGGGSRPQSRDGSDEAVTSNTPAVAENGVGETQDGEDDVEMGDAAGDAAASAAIVEDSQMNDTQAMTENTPRITVDGHEVVEDKMDTT